MSKKKIKFMCTSFRDGFQSAYGARVLTKDFLPAVKAAKEAGIRYFEAGGGARFQSLYFYCNEDAFQMMDSFREVVGPDVDLQTLARGVNVVGLESQPSDIIKLHADLFKKHGINMIRNFDALNDVNNLIYSGKCISEAGLKHQVCVTMMELPPGCNGAHDPEFYIKTLKEILKADIPFDSVCFKDASGTAVPSKVYKTIKEARKVLPNDTFIHFHTHETAGCGVVANKAALEAGADAIDLSLAPVSGGTCQPDIIVMWHALRGTDFDLDVDIEKIRQAEETFKDCMKDYFLPPEAIAVEPLIPWSPMPGGALTANTQMLRDNNIMEKYPEMIKAMREVVERGGYGTSVTPVSQFYFQQAFNNIMFGPWKKIADGYGKMVLGYFGKTPVKPDEEIIKLAAKQLKLKPTEKTPLEINDADPNKGAEAAKKILKKNKLEVNDENIFIVATCKEKGIDFLKGNATLGIRKIEKTGELSKFTVTVDGQDFALELNEGQATVNGKTYKIDIREGISEEIKTKMESKPKKDSVPAQAVKTPKKEAPATTKASSGDIPIEAQMPGKVLKIISKAGETIKVNDPIAILESMKMEIPITSPTDGILAEISVTQGQQVAVGDIIAYMSGN